MNNLLIEIIKIMAKTEKNLNESQINALAVVKHLKSELLYKLNDFTSIEIQIHWYNSAKAMLKDEVKSSFISTFKKPDRSSARVFRRVNRELLDNLEKTIKTVPNSILLETKSSIEINQILPDELFKNTRGYIEKLSNQINICYQNKCYDACSMCMRRLLEILLIKTYQNHKKDNEIQDSTGRNKNLSTIINYTRSNNQFHISSEVLDTMDEFRKLGNYSAHKIEYNCFENEIKKIKSEFRITVQELFYKSGLKK